VSATVLRAALGRYPHVTALGDSPLLRLDRADIPVISRAFAPMVRALAFDVSEMAIATFLMAKAYGKPLVLLPVTMAARFQESALLCRADADLAGPAALAGKRVGVRAYSQTTGMWLRGILSEQFGVTADAMRWVTFEGAHVAEYADPPWTARAPDGADMLAMLRDGTLDAVIVGNDVPHDPGFRTVFPDPEAAAIEFRRRHGFMPVNHLVVVPRSLADSRPELVAELMRLFAAARPAEAAKRDALPFGREALAPAIRLALRFMHEQALLPRPLGAAEIWEGLPADIR